MRGEEDTTLIFALEIISLIRMNITQQLHFAHLLVYFCLQILVRVVSEVVRGMLLWRKARHLCIRISVIPSVSVASRYGGEREKEKKRKKRFVFRYHVRNI